MPKKNVCSDIEVGGVYATNNNGDILIIEYKNSREVVVKFVGYDHEITTSAGHVRDGKIKNVMLPIVKGKGYIGIGEYTKKSHPKIYQTWLSMITRCYCHNKHVIDPSYIGCSVSEEWLNLQSFGLWFEEEGGYKEGYHLDKDLHIQGNKVYSPENCQFVSMEVNNVIVNGNSRRGSHRLGVSLRKDTGKFSAYCRSGKGKNNNLGSFKDEKCAHDAYKSFKYAYIRQLANLQTNKKTKQDLLNYKISEY